MHTRNLVPLDGSAVFGAGRSIPLAHFFPAPSIASSLVDGLEAETWIYSFVCTHRVQAAGTKLFSLVHEISTAEVFLTVADAIQVDRTAIRCPLQPMRLADGSIANRIARH